MQITPTPTATPETIDTLVASHLATLDLIAATTDFPPTIARAETLRRRVNWFARNPATALGMLGANGIGPEIDVLAKSAVFHGFDWRARPIVALPVKKER